MSCERSGTGPSGGRRSTYSSSPNATRYVRFAWPPPNCRSENAPLVARKVLAQIWLDARDVELLLGPNVDDFGIIERHVVPAFLADERRR